MNNNSGLNGDDCSRGQLDPAFQSHSSIQLIQEHQVVVPSLNLQQKDPPSQLIAQSSHGIKPFTLEGLNLDAARQNSLLSQPSGDATGTKGRAEMGRPDRPEGVSIGLSESSSQTSMDSQELNRVGGGLENKNQTFGRAAMQRHLAQTKKEKYEVYMRCVTWSRDSHGLFDYESRYISKKNIKTAQNGRIVRLNNDVEFISTDVAAEDLDPTAKPLITITQNSRGKYVINNDTGSSESSRRHRRQGQEASVEENKNAANMMFIVVRNLKSQKPPEDQINEQQQNSFLHDFRLQRGNIIKLGRLKFSVKDFRTDTQPANCDLKRRGVIDRSASPVKQRYNVSFKNSQDNYSEANEDDGDDSENEFNAEEAIEIDCGVVDSGNSDVQCKVCWSNEQTRTNPLLNSCKCDGSVRFIHYECLKFWLKQKMAVKEEPNQVSYMWKQFECEICKTPYPYVFKSNGIRYRLVDIDIPKEKNFLWLESLTFEKNSSRMVHVVMPDRDHTQFKMGRGHESELRVSDISVSRCHAILKYDADRTKNYYLEDNLSKFGTLVLYDQPIELEVDQTQAVQIGRSVISFTVKQVVESSSTEEQPLLSSSIYQPPQPNLLLQSQSNLANLNPQNPSVLSQRLNPPQILQSIGLPPSQQQLQLQQTTSPIPALQQQIQTSNFQQLQQQQQQRATSFEEQKQLLRTPSPVRRSNHANAEEMLLSASNQQTAYRPHQPPSGHENRDNSSSVPRRMNQLVNGYGNLLDHHQNAFTPPPVGGAASSFINNRKDSDDDSEKIDDIEDPYAAEEILRQKIEETNQKISDYFKKQQRYQQQQQQLQMSAGNNTSQQHRNNINFSNQRHGETEIVNRRSQPLSSSNHNYNGAGAFQPQRLDFYSRHQHTLSASQEPSKLFHTYSCQCMSIALKTQQAIVRDQTRKHQQQPQRSSYVDEAKDDKEQWSGRDRQLVSQAQPVASDYYVDEEAVTIQQSGNQPNSRQPVRTQHGYPKTAGAAGFVDLENDNTVTKTGPDASESLNQTLQRFQSMIKQVEQRFAEREQVSNHYQQQNNVNNHEPRNTFSSPPRRVNEYDLAKHEIEQKQSLLNSQYSLNPSSNQSIQVPSILKTESRRVDQLNVNDLYINQQQRSLENNFSNNNQSRKSLLDILNRAVQNQQEEKQEPQQILQQDSPTRRCTYFDQSRDRLLHNAISKSPTKMFQHPENIKPAAYRHDLQQQSSTITSQDNHQQYNRGSIQYQQQPYTAVDLCASGGSFDMGNTQNAAADSRYNKDTKYQQADLKLQKVASSSSIKSYNRKQGSQAAAISQGRSKNELTKAKSMYAQQAIQVDNLYTRGLEKTTPGRISNNKKSSHSSNKLNSSSVAVYQPKQSRGGAELAQTSYINKNTIGYDNNNNNKADDQTDFFCNASDINLHQQSPQRSSYGRVAKRSSERPYTTSYSMLAQAQQRMRAQRDKDTSSPAHGGGSLHKSSQQRGGSMLHDYGVTKENRRSQMSPIKRQSQASPTKTTSSKRPQSAFKSPSNIKRSANQSYLENNRSNYNRSGNLGNTSNNKTSSLQQSSSGGYHPHHLQSSQYSRYPSRVYN